jgi:hypothetical protein
MAGFDLVGHPAWLIVDCFLLGNAVGLISLVVSGV